MSDLRPCTQCRRHVRLDERTCPFCAIELLPAAPRPVPGGRFTRAAVFAGAALASACSKEAPPTEAKAAPVDAAPAPVDAAEAPPDAEVAAADADLPDAAPVDAAVAKKRPPRPDAAPPVAKPLPEPHHIPKPYGAPPARARLV